MRGWVGVEITVWKKMAKTLCVQEFGIHLIFKASALLMESWFQPFSPQAIAFICGIIYPSAILNLENHILSNFGNPAVKIILKPY